MVEKLSHIEQELVAIFAADKRSWAKVYQLLHAVETEKLYAQDQRYRSFTAFVKGFAATNKIAESSIWRKFKAGRVYAQFAEQQAAAGVPATDIKPADQVKIAEDNLVTIGKLAGNDYHQTATLMAKVQAGDLTRHDLHEAYRAKHPNGVGRATNPTTAKQVAAKAVDEAGQTTATEASITLLLARHTEWLARVQPSAPVVPRRQQRRFGDDTIVKYRTFAQFPVVVPTSRHARRIDVLAVENQTTDPRDLALHCLEIKVSPEDLHHDHKYTEYADFVDYLWLVVADTPVLRAQSEDEVPVPFGILAADPEADKLTVIRPAERRPGVQRSKALTTALLRSI